MKVMFDVDLIVDPLIRMGMVQLTDDLHLAHFLSTLAAVNHLGAQFSLGVLSVQSRTFPRDPSVAAYWFAVAGAQGYSPAQFNAGVGCLMGDGVPKDMSKAAYWFEAAAQQSNADARFNLGP